MTNQHDAPPTTPASEPAPVATPKSSGGGVGRRFLIASTPIVVTLASRTALAGGGKDLVCTKSAMASVTYMSHHKDPLPDKCGCHPDVWYNHGCNSGSKPNVWETCGYTTSSQIVSCFGFNGSTGLSSNGRWKCTVSGQFLHGLAPSVNFQCKINGVWTSCPSSFTQHAVAAMCNASSWGQTGRYGLTVSGVQSYLNNTCWSKSPGSSSTMNGYCNTATSNFMSLLPA